MPELNLKIGDVQKILGLSERTIQQWHDGGLRTDGELESGGGGWRRYSGRDLVCLAVVQILMQCGVGRIRAAEIVNDSVRKYFLIPNYILIVSPGGDWWRGSNQESTIQKLIEGGEARIILQLPLIAERTRKTINIFLTQQERG
jgi:hypothetical protein